MTYLYFISRTAGPEIVPPQTYNYDALNALAQKPEEEVASSDTKADGRTEEGGKADGEEQEGSEEQGHGGKQGGSNATIRTDESKGSGDDDGSGADDS